MTSTIGIYPGTFDPITNGHVDVMARALRVVGKLIIAVADNTPKQPIFSQSLRENFIETLLPQLDPSGTRLEVISFSGLLVDFATSVKASVIIRGLRVVSDFEYEYQMSCVNHKLAPAIETIFIPSSDRSQFISSRFVKEVARLGGDTSHFVPPHVAEALKRFYDNDGDYQTDMR